MLRLTVCNHKGGTGKTTSTIHLAAALGLSGYRVLVVDLDPQGFLTQMMGIPEPGEKRSSLLLFDEEVDMSQLPVVPVSGFDILPASGLLTGRQRKLNRPIDVLWIKEALDQPIDYDVLLFDTAAAVTVYSLSALVASQYAVIPVTPEYQPVYGAEQTFQTIKTVQKKLNPSLHDPWMLLTKVDGRVRSHHQYRHYLRTKYENLVLQGIVRTCASLAVSHPDHSTTFDTDPGARGAIDYANVVEEVIRRVTADKPDLLPTAEESEEEAEAGPWQNVGQMTV
ncbi:MAG: ParA family protein [Rhodothermales bacterium]